MRLRHRRAHRFAWMLLALVLPLIGLLAIVLLSGPAPAPPLRLAPPVTAP